MASLTEDVNRNTRETFTRQDLINGLKLILKTIVEIGGFFTVLLVVAKLLSLASGVLAWVGITLSPVVARNIMYAAAKAYVDAGESERKQIRAVAAWINGGLSFERFIDSSMETYEKIVDATGVAEDLHDVLENLDLPAAEKHLIEQGVKGQPVKPVDVESRLCEMISELLGVDPTLITPETHLIHDLSADSLDIVQLQMEIEEEFHITIPDDDLKMLWKVGDALRYIENRMGLF